MENATKALLIAAGILIAILLVSLFLFFGKRVSDMGNYKNMLAEQEDLGKFNSALLNYDRDDILGYELISLANNVIDYNDRYSTAGRNDEKYTPITLKICFVKDEYLKKLSYDNTMRLFTTGLLYTENARNYTIKSTMQEALDYENQFGGREKASALAKSIEKLDYSKVITTIINPSLTEQQKKEEAENSIKETYNRITNSKL